MPKEEQVGCARPTGGVVGEEPPSEESKTAPAAKEVRKMIQVGKKSAGFRGPLLLSGQIPVRAAQ